jgi:hypothetical protein
MYTDGAVPLDQLTLAAITLSAMTWAARGI